MQRWEYLTVYLADDLDFPSEVDRHEALSWASKSITQQINAHAAQGWEVFDLHWLSDTELMITFKRPVPVESDEDSP
jgi:predicted secreted hydrolase